MLAIVHIGLPKTGSTSIQRFLRTNDDLLVSRGIEVRCDSDELFSCASGTSSGLKAPGECKTWIYSDERLSFAAKHQSAVERIIGSVTRYAQSVRVLAYVRRQDEVFVSSYLSRLLRGERRKFEDLQRLPLQRPFKQIKPWENEVGRDNVIIRRYGASYLRKGLITDFRKHCALPDLKYTLPPRSNSSPPLEILELMRLMNVRFHDHPSRRMVLKKISRLGAGHGRLGMCKRHRMQIVAEVEEEDNKVAERYLGLPRLFEHDFADDHITQDELSSRRILELIEECGLSLPTAMPCMDRDEALEALFHFTANSPLIDDRVLHSA